MAFYELRCFIEMSIQELGRGKKRGHGVLSKQRGNMKIKENDKISTAKVIRGNFIYLEKLQCVNCLLPGCHGADLCVAFYFLILNHQTFGHRTIFKVPPREEKSGH